MTTIVPVNLQQKIGIFFITNKDCGTFCWSMSSSNFSIICCNKIQMFLKDELCLPKMEVIILGIKCINLNNNNNIITLTVLNF